MKKSHRLVIRSSRGVEEKSHRLVISPPAGKGEDSSRRFPDPEVREEAHSRYWRGSEQEARQEGDWDDE